MSNKLPACFISHGGGPWPYLHSMEPVMANLKASLEGMVRELGAKPKAVLMISGHWEASVFSVSPHPNPPMLYDYTGFPKHTYEVQYLAPGAPELAQRVVGLLRAAGLDAQADAQRGFDHGTFTPLVVMYPEADVPIVQLSFLSGCGDRQGCRSWVRSRRWITPCWCQHSRRMEPGDRHRVSTAISTDLGRNIGCCAAHVVRAAPR